MFTERRLWYGRSPGGSALRGKAEQRVQAQPFRLSCAVRSRQGRVTESMDRIYISSTYTDARRNVQHKGGFWWQWLLRTALYKTATAPPIFQTSLLEQLLHLSFLRQYKILSCLRFQMPPTAHLDYVLPQWSPLTIVLGLGRALSMLLKSQSFPIGKMRACLGKRLHTSVIGPKPTS